MRRPTTSIANRPAGKAYGAVGDTRINLTEPERRLKMVAACAGSNLTNDAVIPKYRFGMIQKRVGIRKREVYQATRQRYLSIAEQRITSDESARLD